jgi:uncharacterized membrane protein
MKVELQEDDKLVFPWIGRNKSRDLIVLFNNKTSGMVIWAKDKDDLGYYGIVWDISVFVKYDGLITLSN